PKLNQLDFSTELAQLRAAKPDAVYAFLPGGMGINFIKQFNAGGLAKEMPLIVPGFASDQDIVRAVGDPMVGLFDTSHWAYDLDNEGNRKFVAEFQKEYKRIPSLFAEQGYTAALIIDQAVRDAKGKVEDEKAFHAARLVQGSGQRHADPGLLRARAGQGQGRAHRQPEGRHDPQAAPGLLAQRLRHEIA